MSENRDLAGQAYSVAGQGPAMNGASVTLHTQNGPVQATMANGYVVPRS